MIYEIYSIDRILDELQEGYITNDPVPKLETEKIEPVSRNLYGEYRKDIYIIESKTLYNIILLKSDEDIREDILFKIEDLPQYGIIYHIAQEDNKIYLSIYNTLYIDLYIDGGIKFRVI